MKQIHVFTIMFRSITYMHCLGKCGWVRVGGELGLGGGGGCEASFSNPPISCHFVHMLRILWTNVLAVFLSVTWKKSVFKWVHNRSIAGHLIPRWGSRSSCCYIRVHHMPMQFPGFRGSLITFYYSLTGTPGPSLDESWVYYGQCIHTNEWCLVIWHSPVGDIRIWLVYLHCSIESNLVLTFLSFSFRKWCRAYLFVFDI